MKKKSSQDCQFVFFKKKKKSEIKKRYIFQEKTLVRMNELHRIESTVNQAFNQFPDIEESIKRFLQEAVIQLYQLALTTGENDKNLTAAQKQLKVSFERDIEWMRKKSKRRGEVEKKKDWSIKSTDPFDRCLQEEHQLRLLREWLSNIITPSMLPLFVIVLIKLMESMANNNPLDNIKNNNTQPNWNTTGHNESRM
ncbi:hypothetical protein RFI_03701, partial [Reticulomyxa filosa]